MMMMMHHPEACGLGIIMYLVKISSRRMDTIIKELATLQGLEERVLY